MTGKNWDGIQFRAGTRAWWLIALLAPAAVWIASTPSASSAANGHNYLTGCTTGCDSLSCVVNQSVNPAVAWYYINGSCYYNWVSQTADSTKQPALPTVPNQRKQAAWDDMCFGTSTWGAGSGCANLSGDPVNDNCYSGCIPPPSS
jgi:hypothetical protein